MKRTALSCAIFAALSAGNTHAAERTSSLSVRGTGAATPQVRSVQRDTADQERVTAAANETVELLFADGTSLTLAPGTSILLDRYRYDRDSRTGELRLQIEGGTVRTVGGALNNSREIQVAVPGGTVTIDNGIAFIRVVSGQSEVSLVAGRGVTVKGAGEARVLDKAGTRLILEASGAFASPARKLSVADTQALSNLVNPGLASGVVPNFVVEARSVDTAGEISAANAGATGSTIAPEDRLAEDDTAKDVKLAPGLPDAVAPGLCASGCVAAAPNFDLGTSIGTIANRQHGRTAGAGWRAEYSPGSPFTAQSIINTPAPDYLPDGGYRNSTARVFASSAGTPYSLTLTGVAAPTSLVAGPESGFDCLAGNSGACHSTPILNLSYANSAYGLTYIVAGTDDEDRASNLLLDFAGDMREGEFDAPSQVMEVPLDFFAPGILQSNSVDTTTNTCYKRSIFFNEPCSIFFGNDDEAMAQRDAELARLRALPNLTASLSNDFVAPGSYGLFSQTTTTLTALDGELGSPAYEIGVAFTGTSKYDVFGLQTGFSRELITNFASDFARVCELRDTDSYGNPCFDLALLLFGTNGSGQLLFNFDLDADGNKIVLDFPNYASNYLAIRDDDSFLAVDAISRMPGDSQRMFYATGSVSGELGQGVAAPGITLDRFRLSAGLAPTAVLGRAFVRPDTLLDIAPAALLSTDLLVLNPAYTSAIAAPSRALHYDFAAAGDGTAQSSTISVTLGTLTYNPGSNSAQLSGRTVASTARAGASRYSGGVQSALFSTAAGGGNPNLADSGRAGYLVLENYDPVSAPNGGFERTIESGTASTTNYALLRFGQIEAGGSSPAPERIGSGGFTGFLGGIAEITSGAAGTAIALQPILSNNLQLSTDAATGSVSAAFSSQIGAAGTAATTVRLGGATGLSAFTGPAEYAAMTAAAPGIAAGLIADAGAPNAALISGVPLVTNAMQGWTAELAPEIRTHLTGYRHLQWGFFFGDVAVAGGQLAHSHLSSWVAGRTADPAAPLPSVSADYTGHVFANVSNGDQLYTAAGSYTNHWDFANRVGTGTMSFDDANYSLQTRMLGLRRDGVALVSDSTTLFEGLISDAASPGYIGSLKGGFAAAAGAPVTDGLAQRAALMGQFTLGTTRNGVAYRAAGSFGAERSGP